MSRVARPPHSLEYDLLCKPAQIGIDIKDGRCRDDATHHRHQDPAALDASDNADHSCARILHIPQMRCEVFGHAKRIEKLLIAHSHSPEFFLERGHHNALVASLPFHFHMANKLRVRNGIAGCAEIRPHFAVVRLDEQKSSRGCVVGVASWANQAGGRCFRPVPNREHVFPSVHQKPEPISRSSRGPCGRARRPLSWHSAPVSANAPQNSGFLASATRRTTRSWSFSTRSVGADGSVRGVA